MTNNIKTFYQCGFRFDCSINKLEKSMQNWMDFYPNIKIKSTNIFPKGNCVIGVIIFEN